MGDAWRVKERNGWAHLEVSIAYAGDLRSPYLPVGSFDTAEQAWRFATTDTAKTVAHSAHLAHLARS